MSRSGRESRPSATRRLLAAVRGWLRRPWHAVILVLLLSAAVFASYQAPVRLTLDVGTTYALPYLDGFHSPEQYLETDYAYTTARSTGRLPGVGRSAARLVIRMGGGLPGVEQTVYANGRPVLRAAAGGGFADHALVLPAEVAGDGSLELTWAGEVRSSPADARRLGLAVDRVVWSPLDRVVWPDWRQVLWVALAALAIYLLSRQLRFSAPLAALFSALVVLAVCLGLVAARLYLTIFTARLAFLLFALALALPFLRRGTWAILRRISCEPRPEMELWLWRVVVLVALVKFVGVLYPHIIVLDVHAHTARVYRFLSGDWGSLFLPGSYSLLGHTVGLEGGQFPYSPLFHVLSVPLSLLPVPLPLAMDLLNCVLEVTRNLLIFVLVSRITGRQSAGVWASLFYAFLPAPYYLLSWGNYPTQLGLWAALLAVAFLAVRYERLGRRRDWGWWVCVLILVILSYTVVGLMTVSMLLLLVVVEALVRPGPLQRGRLAAVVGGLVLAEAVAFALYHSGFVDVFTNETLPAILRATAHKTAQVGALQVDPRESLLSNWVANWIFVGNHVTDLGVVFSLSGLAVLLVEPLRRRWRPLLIAWLLVFPLWGLFSGLVADMVLKHIFFMFPLLCLGAGVLAERLWRRGVAGQLVVLLYAMFMAWMSISRWAVYILFKRH